MSLREWRQLADECVYRFPDAQKAAQDHGDLISLGADLDVPTLLYAYSHGLFPMHIEMDEKKMLGWFSPNTRAIIPLDNLHVTRSLRQSDKKYECRIDTCFSDMMRLCMTVPRHSGWIDEEFIEAYTQLHNEGYAHSVEVFHEDVLVGGLYGVSFAGFFAGESMVHTMRDASKVALLHLVEILQAGGVTLLDAQWITPHLESLGAVAINKSEYFTRLEKSLETATMSWSR